MKEHFPCLVLYTVSGMIGREQTAKSRERGKDYGL